MYLQISGDFGLSAGPGRSGDAIFRACCLHLSAFPLHLTHGNCCVYAGEERYNKQPTKPGHSWCRRCYQIRLSSCMLLICAVEPLDHLFKRAEFFGDSIAVGKSNHLSDAEVNASPNSWKNCCAAKG